MLYLMHGLGNKFAIFDLRKNPDFAYQNYQFDYDYDQLIILRASKNADLEMQILNKDGSCADACGNATRCVADIIYQTSGQEAATIETVNRILATKKIAENYQVNMGQANFTWYDIPLAYELDTLNLELLDTQKFGKAVAVNVGNPHLVFFVENIAEVNLAEEVAGLETADLFPENININIAHIADAQNIKLETWERGAGATAACGTGACATAVAAYKKQLIELPVQITMPGGSLKIILNENREILMTGGVKLEKSINLK